MSSPVGAGRAGMDRDLIATAVRAERTALADLVADLSTAQWATQSLCAAWTVRHVVAHLTTTTHVRVPELVAHAVRARGSFDRMEVLLAADLVEQHSDAELVERLRASARSDRRIP